MGISVGPHFGRRLTLATAAVAAIAGAGTANAAFTQAPVGILSGFNGDTIVDAAASTTTATHTANATVSGTSGTVYSSSNNLVTNTTSAAGAVHNQSVFFENGWNGLTNGLPDTISSEYTNVNGGNTTFQLGYNGIANDLADNNTVYFTSGTTGGPSTPTGQTLTLTGPIQAQSLDFLSTGSVPTGAKGPPVVYNQNLVDVTLNFADGTHSTYSQAISSSGDGYGPAPFGPNIAYGQVTTNATFAGTADGNSNHIANGASNGHLYENDISLSTADQNEIITSITFTPNSMVGPTEEIYAISGVVQAATVTPEPATLGGIMIASGFALLRRRRVV